MADFSTRSDAPLPAATLRQKRSGPNVSSSWVIMVLSALIAMVVFFVGTAKPTKTVAVAVAATDIVTGSQLTDSSFRSVQVRLDGEQLSRIVLYQDRSLYVGYTAAGPIAEGDLIAKSQVRAAATKNGLNAMSIPINPSRAAGGDLAIGDRVDVLDEDKGSYAAQDIEVIGVKRANNGGALASSESFHIIVAVNSDQAIAIGGALKTNKIDVIRTTGGSSPDRNRNSSANGSTAGNATSTNSTTTTTAKS